MFIEGNYTFGRLKLNFAVDQRVVIGRTTDKRLDGKTGTILGKSTNHIAEFYIVLLDEPIKGAKAINLIESCLCPIED